MVISLKTMQINSSKIYLQKLNFNFNSNNVELFL